MSSYDTDDYTKSDYILDDADAPESADAIEQENAFRPVPAGDHVLEVHSITLAETTNFIEGVMPDGVPFGFDTRQITVKFCLPGDRRAQIEDRFFGPPSGADAQWHYNFGITKSKQGKDLTGTYSNKFWHFAERLGITTPGANGKPKLTERGRNVSAGWVGLKVFATVKDGTPYMNNQGVEQEGRPNIAFFSYKPADYVAPPKAEKPAKGAREVGERLAPIDRMNQTPTGAAQPQTRTAAKPKGLAASI